MRFYNIIKIINKKIYYNRCEKRKDILNIYLKNILIYKNNWVNFNI